MIAASITSFFILTMMVMILFLASYGRTLSEAKLTSFECGFDSLSHPRRPFSIRFFSLVVLFLVFDVESVLLFPYLTTTILFSTFSSLLGLLGFLLILFFGLLYEWYNSVLDWFSLGKLTEAIGLMTQKWNPSKGICFGILLILYTSSWQLL